MRGKSRIGWRTLWIRLCLGSTDHLDIESFAKSGQSSPTGQSISQTDGQYLDGILEHGNHFYLSSPVKRRIRLVGRLGIGGKLAFRTIDQSRESSSSAVRDEFSARFVSSTILFRQRIDIDFERTDVKSRFNWINRAAIHYLNKTAFWNLAQYK